MFLQIFFLPRGAGGGGSEGRREGCITTKLGSFPDFSSPEFLKILHYVFLNDSVWDII